MEKKYKVSVIIPTYKRPDKLTRAIDSVLNQSFKEVNVIVVDDNNPDTEGRRLTEDIMCLYRNNERVKYIQHPFNKNGSAARNTGVSNTDAEFVCFLDDDDEYLKEKIHSQYQRLQFLSDDWACCYSAFYTEWDNKLSPISTENREGDLYEVVLTRQIMIGAGSNLMIRKKVFDEIGGFDESFQRSQDVEFLVRVLKKHKIAYSDEPGLIIHVHKNHKNIDFAKLMHQYVESFKNEIDSLPEQSKKDFYQRLDKSIFYYYLIDKHDFSTCRKMLLEKKVGLFSIMFYTIKRIYKSVIYRIQSR